MNHTRLIVSNQGRTWFSTFRVRGVRQTSKTGHFGVLQSNSSDYCLNCEKITQSECQKEEKWMTKYMTLSIPFTNDYIFFNMNKYQNISRKTKKNISVQCRQCSAILFWNRSWRDCSVCTTLEDGVLRRTPAQVFQRTRFLFCLFGVEGVKRTAKSSPPQVEERGCNSDLLCFSLCRLSLQ